MKELGVTDGSNNCWYANCHYVPFSKTFSKMSKSKQKGTLAETAVAEYFKQTFPAVERRTLSGKYDKGDISGVPGAVVEVKNQKTYKLSEWMKETETERVNAKEAFGILVVKPNGVGVSRTGDWWAIVTLETITKLLNQVGNAQGLSTQTDRGNDDMSRLSQT